MLYRALSCGVDGGSNVGWGWGLGSKSQLKLRYCRQQRGGARISERQTIPVAAAAEAVTEQECFD